MSTTINKKHNRKLLSICGAILLTITLLVTLYSIHTKALEWPQAMHEPEKKGIGRVVQPCLEDPAEYMESDIIVNESGEGDYLGTQCFELTDEVDVKADFTLEYRLKDSTCNSWTEIPDEVKNSISLYDDVSLDASHKLPLDCEITCGKYTVRPKNCWMRLTFSAGSLEGGKEYYLVFEPTMTYSGATKPLGYYHIYKFKTVSVADGYSWQGETVKLLWTEPSENYITTETPSGEIDSAGTKFYYNECSKIICPGKDQTFSFDIKGQGANNIYGSGSTGNNAGTEPPANHIFIYSEKSLSDDSLIASATKGTITNVSVGVAKAADGMKNVSFVVPKNTLEDGKEYYLVIDENLETNKQNGTARTVGAKIITKFLAKHDDVQVVPSTKATCTESGWADQMKCETCGTIVEQGRELPALGHFASVPDSNHGYIASTCTESGWMPEQKCDRCGIVLSEAHAMDPLGHVPNVIEAKEATCTEDGLSEGQVCARCKEVLVAQEKIPAKGHTEVAIGEAKEATCTEVGMSAGKKCSVCGEVLEAQKEIPVTGHKDVPIGEAKEATCTEVGMTAGKKCSVCGEVLEAQKEIPAKGHTEEVVKGKAATCTEKGLTDGKKCSVCGEVLEAQKDIPALGHTYKYGKCTVCGAEDPNYKPEEPDEPTPVEPDTKFTGLANEADKDGVWWYYTDGKIDKTHTGVDQNKYGWWRVENGKVNFKAQGIYKNAYGWWKTTDGKVTFKENSIYKNEYGWWKCKDSKVDFNAQSIYQNQYGWWKTTGGKVTFKENGVFKNEYGWWKVEKSKVNFKFTGIAKNDYGTWYVKNGKVDFSKNGTVTYAGKAYTVTNGKAKLA